MDKEFEEVYEFTKEKIVKEIKNLKEYKTDIRQSEALIIRNNSYVYYYFTYN